MQSISRRLFKGVSLLILPLLLLQGCVYVWSRSMVTQEIRSSAENNLAYLQNFLERRVADVVDASNTIFLKAEIGQFYAELAHDWFESASDYYMQLRAIQRTLSVLKYSNELIAEVNLFFPGEGLAVNTEYAYTLDTDFLNEIYEAALTQPAHLMNVGGTLYSAYGWGQSDDLTKARMLLFIELQPDVLRQLLTFYSETSTRSSYLLGEATGYLLSSIGADRMTVQHLAPLMEDMQGGALRQTRAEIDGTAYEAFVCYSAYLRLGILQLIPSRVFNQVPDLIGWLILGLCVTTVVILFSLLRVLRRTVGQPVDGLQSAFREAGNGHFSVRLPAQRIQEFDQLARGFNAMAEHIDGLIDTNYRQTIRLQTAELKRLQAQINPHFLYNSFYFLRHLISSDEQEVAEEFCRYLGKYFQYITRSDQGTLSLREEVDHAVNYLIIQLMRFGDTVEADVQPLPEDLQALAVPRLIVEPVVENCFKYGLNTTEDRGRIRLRYEEDEQSVSVIIENNGNDLTDEAIDRLRASLELPADETTSFTGLINTHHRLKLFFGQPTGVEVTRSTLGGLMVRLRLGRSPLDPAGKEKHA